MKKLLLTLFAFSYLASADAQLTVVNPSFEGPPGIGIVPVPWRVCYGTPDTQPGQFMVTTTASDGATYIGLVTTTGGDGEGASQVLSAPMEAGQNYFFTIDLAYAAGYSGWTAPCKLRFYGTNADCGITEVLWTSPLIAHLDWQEYTFDFTPAADYTHITFRAFNEAPGSANILLDNLRPIIPNTALSGNASPVKDTVCANDCTVINGFASGGDGGPYTFSWSSIPSGFTSADQNPSVCPSATTEYILEVTDGSGATLSDTTKIEVLPLPNVDAGMDTAICLPGITTLNATGADAYLWTPSIGLSQNDIPNPNAFPNVTTLYKVLGTDAFGCSAEDSVLVEVIEPTPPLEISCSQITNTSMVYEWTITPNLLGIEYSIDGGNTWTFFDSSTTSIKRTNLEPFTEYETKIKEVRRGNCPGYTITMTCTTNGCEELLLNLISNKDSVVEGEGFILSTSVNGGSGDYDYRWEHDSSNNSPLVSLTQNAAQEYVVWVKDAQRSNCPEFSDTVTVFQKEKCEFYLHTPNAISPNGDNINDYWTPVSSCVKEMSLSIFNRWGEKIFFSSGNQVVWPENQEQYKPGIYLYKLSHESLNGESGTKHGIINLVP